MKRGDNKRDVVTVGQTYSSIERHTKGEFSYGWKMFIRYVDVKEDSNRNVTIDLPDGRRVTFHYNIKQQNPLILRAVWESEPGVYDKLEIRTGSSMKAHVKTNSSFPKG